MTQLTEATGSIGPVTKTFAVSSAVASAISIVIVWVLAEFFNMKVPVHVSGAFVIILTAIGTVIGGRSVSPAKTIQHQAEQGELTTNVRPPEFQLTHFAQLE